jgi:hypothetical protein
MTHRQTVFNRLSRRSVLGVLGPGFLSLAWAAALGDTLKPVVAAASGLDDDRSLTGPAPHMAGAARATGPPGSADLRPVPRALRPGGEFDRFVRQQAEQDLFSGTGDDGEGSSRPQRRDVMGS